MSLITPMLTNGRIVPAAGGGVSTLTYQTSTSADTHGGSITMPAGISSGDIIVVCQSAVKNTFNTTAPTAAYGTGFTSIGTDTVSYDAGGGSFNNLRMCLSAKIADGSEASSSISGFMNDNREAASVYVYRPDATPTTMTPTGYVSATSNADPASQTVLAGSSTTAHIVIAHYSSRSTTPTITYSGATSDADFDDIGSVDCRLASRATGVASGSGANVTIDINDNNRLNGVAGCYIEVE